MAARLAPAQTPSLEGVLSQFQPAAAVPDDSPLRMLLKQRYNTTLEEVTQAARLWQGGKIEFDGVTTAQTRLGEFGLELAETPAQKIAHWERMLAASQTLETITRGKLENGSGPPREVLRAKGMRLDAEIGLLREREAAKPK
jgi:hypothetical protein